MFLRFATFMLGMWRMFKNALNVRSAYDVHSRLSDSILAYLRHLQLVRNLNAMKIMGILIQGFLSQLHSDV